MPKEAPDHPQVTEAQVELWLANPVTKTFMQVLEWKAEWVAEQSGKGVNADPSSADFTHAETYRAIGQQQALAWAQNPEVMLEADGMIYHPPEEKKEDD